MPGPQARPLQHVKAHGALYNMAAKDPALADAIAAGIKAAAPGPLSWPWPAPRW